MRGRVSRGGGGGFCLPHTVTSNQTNENTHRVEEDGLLDLLAEGADDPARPDAPVAVPAHRAVPDPVPLQDVPQVAHHLVLPMPIRCCIRGVVRTERKGRREIHSTVTCRSPESYPTTTQHTNAFKTKPTHLGLGPEGLEAHGDVRDLHQHRRAALAQQGRQPRVHALPGAHAVEEDQGQLRRRPWCQVSVGRVGKWDVFEGRGKERCQDEDEWARATVVVVGPPIQKPPPPIPSHPCLLTEMSKQTSKQTYIRGSRGTSRPCRCTRGARSPAA